MLKYRFQQQGGGQYWNPRRANFSQVTEFRYHYNHSLALYSGTVKTFWWEQNSCFLEFVCVFGEAVKRAGEKVMLEFVDFDHQNEIPLFFLSVLVVFLSFFLYHCKIKYNMEQHILKQIKDISSHGKSGYSIIQNAKSYS